MQSLLKSYKKKLLENATVTIIALLFSLPPTASFAISTSRPTVDIYGTTEISQEQVQQKLKREIPVLADIINKPDYLSSKSLLTQFGDLHSKIINKIDPTNHFAYINLSIMIYPGDKYPHFTIDVVEQKDKKRRMSFLPKPTKSFPDPDHLLQSWKEYEQIGMNVLFTERKVIKFKTCPAFHCSFGFEDKRLSKYQSIFTLGAEKNKSILLNILKFDKEASKRATAAYLLAHIKNRDELLRAMIPAIFDPDASVRNNAMRVLAFTLHNSIPTDFPINKIIMALDFPTSIDRNKAMAVLLSLVKQPKYAQIVKQQAANLLLNELKLEQPNNHDVSYELLRRMSGLQYSDRNYQAWTDWFKTGEIKITIDTSTPL